MNAVSPSQMQLLSGITHGRHSGGQRSRRRPIPALVSSGLKLLKSCCFVPAVNTIIVGTNSSDTFPSKTMTQRFPRSQVHDIRAENSLRKNSAQHWRPTLSGEKSELQMKSRVIMQYSSMSTDLMHTSH